jgi:TM2 domain-containing membrane protein YozV
MDHATGRRFLACDVAELDAVFSKASVVAPPAAGRAPSPLQQHPPQSAIPVVVSLDALKPRRSRTLAGILGIFLGPFGIHRFYLGYTGVGTLMLVITLFTCGFGAVLTGIWGLIEGILCLVGAMTDADGRKLGV